MEREGIEQKLETLELRQKKKHRNHFKLRINNNCVGGSHIVSSLPLDTEG